MFTIILYHMVLGPGDSAEGELRHDITWKNFTGQLEWLKKNRSRIIPFKSGELKNAASCDLAITFDDGYSSIFRYAIPKCIEEELPVCVFLTGSLLQGEGMWRDHVRAVIDRGLIRSFVSAWNEECDKKLPGQADLFYKSTKSKGINSRELSAFLRNFLSAEAPDVLAECAALGPEKDDLIHHPLVYYGNHGYSHFVMSSLTQSQQREEIMENERIIRPLVSSENYTKIFALPFGNAWDCNQATLRILKESGYTGVAYSRNRCNMPFSREAGGMLSLERWMAPSDLRDFRLQLRRLPLFSSARMVRDGLGSFLNLKGGGR